MNKDTLQVSKDLLFRLNLQISEDSPCYWVSLIQSVHICAQILFCRWLCGGEQSAAMRVLTDEENLKFYEKLHKWVLP